MYHTDLADAFADMGQYENARKEYELALGIDRELDDERGEGVDLGQLGTLAMKQGDLNEARKRYLEAVSLFQRMGEEQSASMMWGSLGLLAKENKDWDEAEKCYKEAMALHEKLGDYMYAAVTCNNLAIVAENAGRPQEAERWYLRAIELGEKLNLVGEIGKWLSNLASLYLSQNRLDEAEEYARRALAIKETLDLSSEPWKTYNILAQLAEKRGRMDDVRAWRRKEQESFAAFAGSDTQIKKHEPLIQAVVNAVNGDEQAKTFLEGEYPKMKAGSPDWAETANAIQLIVAGERNAEKLLSGAGSQSGLVIRRVLQALSEGTVDGGQQTVENGPLSAVHGQAQAQRPSPQPSPKQGEGVTLPQLLELVERAARGDQQLGGQLFSAFQGMARDPNPAMSTLGNILLRVLVGDHNPDLTGLPDEVASLLRGMLGRLKNT
jgi:tetratricopeptide (TPR) repeat protein